MLQLSHPYMTTGKTVALIRRTFVGRVMSLLLNTLSQFVQASFKFMASVTVHSEIKSVTASTFSPSLAQMVKHLPTMWETWVQSLGQEDDLEKEMATHSSTLAWKNPMDGGAW